MPTDSPIFEISPQEPKTGLSSSTKILLIVLAVFGILIVLCCGGILLVVYFGAQKMKDAVSEDPKVVASVTDQITDITIPEKLKPITSIALVVPITEKSMMTIVVYADRKPPPGQKSNDQSLLVLSEMGDLFDGQNQNQMQKQLEQRFDDDEIGQLPPGNWQEEKSQHEVVIRDETVSFEIIKLKDADSKKSRIRVEGSFTSESGNPTILILSADTEVISEEEVIEMLDSIK